MDKLPFILEIWLFLNGFTLGLFVAGHKIFDEKLKKSLPWYKKLLWIVVVLIGWNFVPIPVATYIISKIIQIVLAFIG